MLLRMVETYQMWLCLKGPKRPIDQFDRHETTHVPPECPRASFTPRYPDTRLIVVSEHTSDLLVVSQEHILSHTGWFILS